MKNLKYLLAVLVFALVISGATKASAAALAANCYTIDYANELVYVTSDDTIYYQVIKAADANTGLKATNWIEITAKKKENNVKKSVIDFSALANTKETYIAITNDNTATAGDQVVTIKTLIKSVKATLNYTEESPSDLYDIISTLTVAPITENAAIVSVPTTGDGAKTVEYYSIEWKRGANGNWAAGSSFDAVTWNAMKASNTTLYLRLNKYGSGNDTVAFRASKEVKLKIPKAANAPSIKVDYTKNTVSIKNGMEFHLSTASSWTQVLTYNKNSENDASAYATPGSAVDTKVQKSTLSVSELLEKMNVTAKGTDVTVLVRVSATSKKFASKTATVTFKTPAAAPTKLNAATFASGYAAASSGSSITLELKKYLGDSVTVTDYEYVICKAADAATAAADAKTKWTAFKSDSIALKSAAKATYYVNGTKTDVLYSDATCILIRKAANKTDSLFASGILTITKE